MFLWNIINTLLALVALVFGIWGVTANVGQYRLSRRQDEDAKKQSKIDEEWLAKFGLAARNLASIGNKSIAMPYQGFGYHIVFPNVELRQRIEAYLVTGHTVFPRRCPLFPLPHFRIPFLCDRPAVLREHASGIGYSPV